MHKFAIVRLKTPWAKAQIYSRILRQMSSQIPFIAKQKTVLKLSEDLVFFGSRASDYLGVGPGYHEDETAFTAFDGYAYIDKPDETARALHEMLGKVAPAGFDVGGQYSIIRLEKATGRFSGIADFTGMRPLYYIDNPDFFAVSNRQMLLNPICTRNTRPTIDVWAATSLISKGNKFGHDSLIAGVNMVPPGHFVVSSSSGFSVKPLSNQVWQDRRRPTTPDYQRAAENLVENLSWFSRTKRFEQEPISLSLTGGEDSRLVLSLAMNSAFKEKLQAFTYGFSDNPDIYAAKDVAAAAGVPHSVTINERTASQHTIEGIWKNLRSHAFRFEGAPGAWDGGAGSAKSTNLDMTGVFDFFFKRVRPGSAALDVTSEAVALDHMRESQQEYDVLGLLRPEARQKDNDFDREWLDRRLSDGLELNDVPEIYYQENRLSWWGGGIDGNVNNRLRVTPLADRFASWVGLKQSVQDRRERRFIFEAMLHLAPDLLRLPYVNKKWPDRFQDLAPQVKLPGVAFSMPPSAPSPGIPWQVELAKNGGKFILDYIARYDLQEIYDIVDKQRLEECLSDPSKINNHAAVRSIINIAEVLILMAGGWSRDFDNIENHGLEIGWNTNVPEVQAVWEGRAPVPELG